MPVAPVMATARPVASAAVSGQVHLERDGHVGRIILDHPERHNAISAQMWDGITAAASELENDHEIRVVVIRGAGERAFAAGADISQFGAQRSDASGNRSYDDTTSRAHAALLGLSKPLIAAIHGYCIGGGLAVALTADLRVAAEDAQFTIPAARLGLGYGAAGIGTLMRLVGPSAAKRIFFLADRFGAQEALQMGLVNLVVPKAHLETSVDEWTELIGQNAPLTIAAAKAALTQWQKPESQRDFTEVEAMIGACFDSEDYQEGVDAVYEQAPARIQGPLSSALRQLVSVARVRIQTSRVSPCRPRARGRC